MISSMSTRHSKSTTRYSSERTFYVYIMTNDFHTVLYTGVTNDLERRVTANKQGLTPAFTRRYAVRKLVYCEEFDTAADAIAREKQIKGGSRLNKIRLINSANPKWNDLAAER
ncbi:MAG: GIY-YIG nuclease family protein [bacterium]